MEVEELEKLVKAKGQNSNQNSIYILYGEEKFLLNTIVKRIKKNFGECIRGINYIIIDDTNIKEAIQDIQTPAFGYPKKLIIFKNSGILSKEGKRKNPDLEDTKRKMYEFLKNEENLKFAKENNILIFIEENIEKLKLYKLLEKESVVCEFKYQKPYQIIKRLKYIANAYRVNASENTLQYLIEECGQNMENLINEIRKLIEYAGPNGVITKEEIDLLCIKQSQAVIFDLTDNLGNRNVKRGINILRDLTSNKEPIQKILITLYNHFKKLYLTKQAVKYNLDIAKSLNLKPNQLFLVNKYKNQAKAFTEEEIFNIIKELINLDYNYKNGNIDINVGLETILCNYFSK